MAGVARPIRSISRVLPAGLALLLLACGLAQPGAAAVAPAESGQQAAAPPPPPPPPPAAAASPPGGGAAAPGQPPGVDPALRERFVQARAAGDCRGLEDALRALAPQGLGPYPALQGAACAAQLGDPAAELAAATAALASDGGGPRLARIEAYERGAEASLKLGNDEQALDLYSHALELAGTRSYRAEMLFTTGQLAHQVGRDDLAAERLRSLVVDFADQPRAPAALDLLAAMGAGATISPYQAGIVRSNAGQYAAAAAQLEAVPDASPDAGAAHLAHAAALVKLDRGDEALAELSATAQTFPSQSGAALLRMGRLLERNGQYADADAAYWRVLQVAPESEALPEALFRAGLTRYLRDDWGGALAAWQQGLEAAPAAPASARAKLSFWRGKALARLDGAASADARTAWAESAAASQDTYYGLRAGDMLQGELSPVYRSEPAAPRLDLPADQQAERARWLASFTVTAAQVANDVNADPGLARAERLLPLGLRDEAGWEVDGLARRYADAKDLPHLSALGDWATSHDLPEQTLLVGRMMGDVARSASLPRAVLRHLYPAGFGQLAVDKATVSHVDPLLLLALVRQESSFNPTAASRAGALGLTQVVPATGRGIAQGIGRGDQFQPSDLFDPAVSLEYGARYLASMAQRYAGRLLPTIASYDAGGGNVDRWLQAFGDDPDVLYELVPFDETHTYIDRVYVNYRLYQRLYGA